MDRAWIVRLVMLGAWSLPVTGARAETTVRVVATDPSGDHVRLPRNRNFYLRLAYAADRPIRIWVRPYFQGEEVRAGTKPSGSYVGTGEALAWFFLMRPGDEVDELRISAGDGSSAGTRQVETYTVHIAGSAQTARAEPVPAWVAELTRVDELATRAAIEKSANTPLTASDSLRFHGLMLALPGLALLGFIAPAWGVWRWRGGWRAAAAIPAAAMCFVVLRILIDVLRDPTSHNLWPFELMQVGLLSALIVAALWAAQKLMAAPRRE